ncbi:MAG: hypothetical protein AB1640_07275 [bacterium]
MKGAKQYERLNREAEDLAGEIRGCETQRTETSGRICELAESAARLEADLSRALAAGSGAEDLEGKLRDCRAAREREQLMLRGLGEKLTDLRGKLEAASGQRDRTFADLARTWLEREAGLFDEKALSLRHHTKRLMAAHDLLRELRDGNLRQVFVEVLGDFISVLTTLRIPVIEGFDRTEHARNPFTHPGRETLEQVRNEIVTAK